MSSITSPTVTLKEPRWTAKWICRLFDVAGKNTRSIATTAGLGNQMFQYAFFLAIRKKFPSLTFVIDRWWFAQQQGPDTRRTYLLQRTFGIRCTLLDRLRAFWIRAYGARLTCLDVAMVPFERLNQIDRPLLYFGGWQSPRYFESIRSDVVRAFRFRPPATPRAKTLLDRMAACTAVSVHVRRSDYLHDARFRDIYDDGYYGKAMDHIRAHVENPTFFVMSDDPEWCKGVFGDKDVVIVDHDAGQEAYVDMFLMTRCAHNIIANSSYGWWGAWLNEHPGKIVVTPAEWFEGEALDWNMDDLLPKEWVRI